MAFQLKNTKVKDVQWFHLFSEGVLLTIFTDLKFVENQFFVMLQTIK